MMLRYIGARRLVLAGAMLGIAASLAACTTIEGTNAVGDIGTFEREVGQETLKGLGMIPRESKEPIKTPRGLLALPKSGAPVGAPTEAVDASILPEDSDTPKIDMAGLSQADVERIRKIVVFDGRADSGRKLTEAEIAQVTKKISAGNLRIVSGSGPLWVPDQSYFTTSVNGQDAVCLAPDGDLVPINDPKCPAEIRAELAQKNQ